MKWIVALFVVAISGLAPAQAWKSIASREAGLQFSVPSQPQTSTRTDKDGGYSVQTRLWISSAGNSNYVVSVSFLPKDVPAKFTQNMIDGIKSGFLKSTGGTATSDKPATFARITGRQIEFSTSAGVKGAIWIVKNLNKVYTFTVAKQDGKFQAGREKFFGSIKLS